jgi:hypothetical protein
VEPVKEQENVMKVKELIQLLENYHDEQEVAFVSGVGEARVGGTYKVIITPRSNWSDVEE